MSVNTGLNINTGRPLDLGRGGTGASLTAANNHLVYSGSSAMALLATANNSLLVTNGSGVPSISTTIPNGIALGTPASGDITNCTGNPTLGSVAFSPTTHGIVGTTTNNNAMTGYVGEFISNFILFPGAISLTNGTLINLVSISLTAGDWDVFSNATFNANGILAATFLLVTSPTSAPALPDQSFFSYVDVPTPSGPINYTSGTSAPYRRFSLAVTTTIYAVVSANFSIGTVSVCGGIYARRVR